MHSLFVPEQSVNAQTEYGKGQYYNDPGHLKCGIGMFPINPERHQQCKQTGQQGDHRRILIQLDHQYQYPADLQKHSQCCKRNSSYTVFHIPFYFRTHLLFLTHNTLFSPSYCQSHK